MTTSHSQEFKLHSEKVHSVRYEPVGAGPFNKMMPYVPKDILPKPYPQTIKITIEV